MKNKVPNDLGLKVANKEEAYWIKVKDRTQEDIIMHEESMRFLKAVLEMAKEKIEKFK